MSLKWSNISIKRKIILVLALILFFFALVIFGFLIPQVNKNMINLKKEKLKEIVQAGISLLTTVEKMQKDGKYTLQEAQALGIKYIKEMRFGPENKDYIWINDFQPKMIMHPYRTDLDGKDLSDYKDPHGKFLFKEFVDVCSKAGEGFVDYDWQWKDREDLIVEKVSFVKTFEPWKWIIGTGIYLEDVKEEIKSIKLLITIVFVFVILASFLGVVLLAGAIASPIIKVEKNLRDVSAGDLTINLEVRGTDEVGSLVKNFNEFVGSIKNVIKNIKLIADELAVSSEEMNAATQSFSDNAQNQSATAEEITATVEEVSAGMDNVAIGAGRQFEKLNQLIGQINDLSRLINEMGNRMQETQKMVEDVTTRAQKGDESLRAMNSSMIKISDSSNEMSSIVNIINTISDQINLLSLNAAIEAARAGDAGRGFAVVADEISKLADKTATSINEISKLIKGNDDEIRKGMQNVNETVENTKIIIKGVGSIRELIQAVYDNMKKQLDVNSVVNEMADEVKASASEIKSSTEEQKNAVFEIVKSITNINELTQANASGSEQMSANSITVTNTAEDLKRKVEFFKID